MKSAMTKCRLLFGSVVVAVYQCVADVATTALEVYGPEREWEDLIVRNAGGLIASCGTEGVSRKEDRRAFC